MSAAYAKDNQPLQSATATKVLTEVHNECRLVTQYAVVGDLVRGFRVEEKHKQRRAHGAAASSLRAATAQTGRAR